MSLLVAAKYHTERMWAVTNHTPYKVGRAWGRDKDGVHEWIVAVKGTFDIKPDGSLKLADEQLEPLLLPEYNGEAGVSSLRYDADLVAPKPTTDVVLNGTAYAPRDAQHGLSGFGPRRPDTKGDSSRRHTDDGSGAVRPQTLGIGTRH